MCGPERCEQFELSEDNEDTITVRSISTTLLTLLPLPMLRSSASKYNIEPVISVVGSGLHGGTSFPERKTPNSLATIDDRETANLKDQDTSPRSLQLSHAASLPSSVVSPSHRLKHC